MARGITVAVPTHNRGPRLQQTLRSIAELTIPAGFAPRCVVVDNCSRDVTRAVVERFAAEAPFEVRYVFEPQLGSSRTRNRAIAEASGEYLLFIDDDAVAEPQWLAAIAAAMDDRALDVGCGAVLPRWEAEAPKWLGPRLYAKLAVHDPSALAAEPLEQFETLAAYFSANVCFRRTILDRCGWFSEDLGVVGGRPYSGEDTELFARIAREGGRVGFVPQARVHHMIAPERMTARYLRHKSFAFGMGSAVAASKSHNRPDKLAKNLIRMARAAINGDREGALYHELECWNFAGYWSGRLVRLRSQRHNQ